MSRKMDFEAKYKAKEVKPFNQGNEMWKRPRRDIELKDIGKAFYRHQLPQCRPGYNLQDIGLRNASWFLESKFSRGIYESNFGLYSWEDSLYQMSELPMDPPLDSENPEYNTRMIKRAAKFFGADMVGICKLDKRWIYSKGFNLFTREEFDIHL